MTLQASLRRSVARVAYTAAKLLSPNAYAQDGLVTVHAHDFMRDPSFSAAYSRGLKAIGTSDDYEWHWRIHVGLWAASVAARVPGDFVECGVNKGFLSSAIMAHIRWETLEKTFYLLDTYKGVDPRFVSEEERREGKLQKNDEDLKTGFYVSGVEEVRSNFSEWPRVRIVEGTIPDTLSLVDADSIAYLHIDMNCAPPEVAALEHFWPLLSPGAVVLLDDYAYFGFGRQKEAMDQLAAKLGVGICSLPTGQGLLIKPPSA